MNDKIKCPNCGHEFEIEEALSGKIEAHYKAEYEKKVSEQSEKLNDEKRKLKEEKEQLELQKDKQDELLQAAIDKQLKKEREKIAKQVGASVESEMKSLQEENDKRKAENKTLKEKEISFLKREAELIEKQEDLSLQMEKELLERQKEIEDKGRAKERESFELEKIKLLKQIDDNKRLAEEMKRKAEQGSMQMQGEVQELAIEEWLADKFPLDMIQEIKKGERGADCIQIVHTRTHQNCGTIYYESKRTKSFQPGWIEKFKADIREKNANIGVLVTEVMPPDMERLGLKDGIWICSYDEFKGLCTVLRESIIQLSTAIITQENKGDKMGMLYDFLTSNEFRLQIEAIVEGFTQMKSDLESEQRSMRSIWKKREKQIDKVLLNTTDMYGSIRGIAGNAVQAIALLELPQVDELDL